MMRMGLGGPVPKKGRVAWVTGAGRGIGAACAEALSRAGLRVALTSRTRVELEATAKRLGGDAFVAPADVTDEAAVGRAHRAIVKKLGPPLILVNAAGLARSAPFLGTTPQLMESLWRLNLMGSFHAIQTVVPAMVKEGWGRIVNVASVAAKAGAPYIAAYASSKHALLGLTRSVAAEFASKGITANAVCPGYVDTQMTGENVALMVEKTGRTHEQIHTYLRAQSPQNRLMRPEEVADAVLYLCREASQGINGQALTIDGGALQW